MLSAPTCSLRTVSSPHLSGLPVAEVRSLRRLVAHRSIADLQTDAGQIEVHYQELVQARQRNEFLDLVLAREIADALKELVQGADSYTDDQRALLYGAVRYFLLVEDHDDDMSSSIGLEDDARVTNAVAAELGRPDLAIPLP